MKKEHKQILALIGGLGLLGGVSYFVLGASLASLTVGGYGVLFFLTTYATIMANVFAGMKAIDIIGSIYREQFIKKMPIKYGGAYQVYEKVSELEKDLNYRLSKQDSLQSSAKVINYKAIKKLQNNISGQLNKLNALTEKEAKAFNKFYHYKTIVGMANNMIESLNFNDWEIEKQMAASEGVKSVAGQLHATASESTQMKITLPEKGASSSAQEVAKIIAKNSNKQTKTATLHAHKAPQSAKSSSRTQNESTPTERTHDDDRQL